MSDHVAVLSDDGIVMFWCEGCLEMHCIWQVQKPNPRTGASWTWNGDLVRPTFSPSVLVAGFIEAGRMMQPRCHFYIRDGRAEYLSDCEHELAGKTVPLLANPLAQ